MSGKLTFAYIQPDTSVCKSYKWTDDEHAEFEHSIFLINSVHVRAWEFAKCFASQNKHFNILLLHFRFHLKCTIPTAHTPPPQRTRK